MSTQDPNLLNFLKNQSLFNQSPTKRVNSRSRDRISGANRNNSPAYNQPIGGNNFTNFNSTSNPNLNSFNQGSNILNANYPQPTSNGPQASLLFNQDSSSYNQPAGGYPQGSNNFSVSGNNYTQGTYAQGGYPDNNNLQINQGFQQNQVTLQANSSLGQIRGGTSSNLGGMYNQDATRKVEDRFSAPNFTTNMNNLLTNVVTYSTSFQSARVESMSRLERLGDKVRLQLNNLNLKLDIFSSELHKVVNLNFTQTKERIYMIVQEAFRDSDQYLRQYIRAQEMRFAQEIIKAKQVLDEEISHIEAMRLDINKPYWKNTAGVFITSEFQTRVETIIKQYENIEVRRADFEIQGLRLADIEKYLIESVRVKLENLRDSQYH